MEYIPENPRFLFRTILFVVLCLNILSCVIARFRSLTCNITTRKLGDLLLHLGIALIILAGLLGGPKHSAYIQIKEHETVDLEHEGFPIAVRAEVIEAEYYAGGAVKQYFTTISILESGREVDVKHISVNHPASYKEIKIYQSTFRTAPGGNISGLTVKSEQGLPFVRTGLLSLAAGSVLILLGRRHGVTS
nr:cytochrome c biogenesis protein ResB [Pelotomaculum isophthalicicum]